jgi:hypothetical protein
MYWRKYSGLLAIGEIPEPLKIEPAGPDWSQKSCPVPTLLSKTKDMNISLTVLLFLLAFIVLYASEVPRTNNLTVEFDRMSVGF